MMAQIARVYALLLLPAAHAGNLRNGTTTASAPAPTSGGLASGCCVYTQPVTINGGEFTLEPKSCANDAPNEFSCPLTPVASDLCPRGLIDESQWHYDQNMWGKSGASDDQLKTGMQNAACVWAAVCKGNEACLSRCPVAMGIAGMESLFNPSVVAGDGGYGLWQVGGPSAPSTAVGLSEEEAKNPLILGKWVRQVTNQGEYFSPKNRCWSTCEGKLCNPQAASSWESGWVASWAATASGGAQAYSESTAVGDACTAAIQKMYPSLAWTGSRFTRRGSCTVGEQITVGR